MQNERQRNTWMISMSFIYHVRSWTSKERASPGTRKSTLPQVMNVLCLIPLCTTDAKNCVHIYISYKNQSSTRISRCMTLVVTVWCFLYYFHRLSSSDDATRNVKNKYEKTSLMLHTCVWYKYLRLYIRIGGQLKNIISYAEVICFRMPWSSTDSSKFSWEILEYLSQKIIDK